MSDNPSGPDQSSGSLGGTLKARVKVLLAARLAVISFFMGLVVFYKAREGHDIGSLPALTPVAAAYFLSIIYAVSLRFVRDFLRFVNVQIFLDIILISLVIYYTGGVNSPFSFLYILVIIATAIFLDRRSTYVSATAASAAYCLLLALEHGGFLRPHHVVPPVYNSTVGGFVFMTGVMRVAVFYLVAYLSGYLTSLLGKINQQLTKKSEDLLLLEAFHKNVVDNMGSGLLAMNMEGMILSHNPAAEKILGLPAEKISGSRAETALRLPGMKRFFRHLRDMEGDFRDYDWTCSKGDEKAYLHMTISKFVADGQVKGAVAVLSDVTERKRMEMRMADSERLAAIGRVAASIAHEIRNPLASLSGSIQMLKAEAGPSADGLGERLMDIILRETERLNRTVTQFLGYASQPKLSLSRVNVSEILLETLLLLKSDPENGGKYTFVEDLEEDLCAVVDQERVKQITWNLLVNAMDAMKDGGTLTVRAARSKSPFERRQKPRKKTSQTRKSALDFVRIEVNDTGPGIKPEDLPRIFEPFYTTKKSGTGLGLSTVSKIVESHGGVITAESTAGAGTTFRIWLPMEPARESRPDKKAISS
ncbi:MAG: two-component system sensor histidine kinase NtrB [Candidatus Nitrospinota bacterium M3_3B_026]